MGQQFAVSANIPMHGQMVRSPARTWGGGDTLANKAHVGPPLAAPSSLDYAILISLQCC